MPRIITKVRTTGMQEAIAFIDGVKVRSKDLGPPLKAGGLVMVGSIHRNFQDSGRPKRWKRLAISTASAKARMGKSTKPLIRIGVLRNSIAFRVTGHKLITGTSSPYARIHQFGGTTHPKVTPRMRKWAWRQWYESGEDMYKGIALTKKKNLAINIPARPFVLFQRQDLDDLSRLIVEHITGRKNRG